MKNDNIHPFCAVLVANFEFAGFASKQKYTDWFPWKRSILQNPHRERTNKSTGICRRLALPYNKYPYFYKTTFSLEKLHFLALITKTLGFTVIFVPSALKVKLNVCSFVFEGRVQYKITMNSVAHTLAIFINIASAFAMICPSGTTDTCLLQTFSGKCQLE